MRIGPAVAGLFICVAVALVGAGNRVSLSTRYQQEAAKVATYEYDRANRLTKVTSPEGEVTSFTYDAAGHRATAIQPNGITTTWTYDARGRVTAIAHKKTAGGAIVAQYDYTFNAQGLRATQTFRQPEGAGSSTCRSDYTYDALGRLTGSQVRNVAACPFFELSHTYTYDAVGNRLTESEPTAGTPRTSSFTYDAADRLIAVTGNKQATYEYDANGNLTKQTLPKPPNTPTEYPAQVTQYRWDAEGRLIGMTAPDARVFTYLYDAEGQLVREIQGTDPNTAAVTYYLADKNLAFSQILEERDGAGILKVGYQYAETKPIKQSRSGVSSYYLGDHLSTRILTDGSGTAQNVYTYRPYGEVERQTGAGANNTPAVGNSVLFAGERFDSSLALYYNRARWMDPRAGRLEGTDPHPGAMASPLTLNKYVYGSDDPINRIDPTGRFTMGDVISAINVTTTLSTQALDVYQTFFGNPDDERLDGPPGLWDLLMAIGVRAAAGGLVPSTPASRASRAIGRLEEHHTIPWYVCGHKYQRYSLLPKPDHDELHNTLYGYTWAINLFGTTVDLVVFKKPSSRIIKTPTQRLGTKAYGRGAIAAGLASFYARDGWLGEGTPPIGWTLLLETPRFVGKHHSAPSCQRPR